MDAARTVVWLGGRFVPLEEARVSFFDAGLQHGVGLFETMVKPLVNAETPSRFRF